MYYWFKELVNTIICFFTLNQSINQEDLLTELASMEVPFSVVCSILLLENNMTDKDYTAMSFGFTLM